MISIKLIICVLFLCMFLSFQYYSLSKNCSAIFSDSSSASITATLRLVCICDGWNWSVSAKWRSHRFSNSACSWSSSSFCEHNIQQLCTSKEWHRRQWLGSHKGNTQYMLNSHLHTKYTAVLNVTIILQSLLWLMGSKSYLTISACQGLICRRWFGSQRCADVCAVVPDIYRITLWGWASLYEGWLQKLVLTET